MNTVEIEYKQLPYKKFVTLLDAAYKAYRKDTLASESDIAVCMGKTTMTVRNCMQPMAQMVSDKILTGLMKCIGFKGKIEWIEGVRYYYVENSN